VPVDGLREIDHGRWEGMRRAEVEAQFPEEYAGWEADPFTLAPEGGEAGLNVLARALPVIRRLGACPSKAGFGFTR
jgi:broad specificity phosphatase PhoE